MRLVAPSVVKAAKPRVRLRPLVVEVDDPVHHFKNVKPMQFGAARRNTPRQALLNALEFASEMRGVAIVWIDHDRFTDQMWAGVMSLERIGLAHVMIDRALRGMRDPD